MMLPSKTDNVALCSTRACSPSSVRWPRAARSSDAATALSFTQPAISQQIARLERQLGTRLLVRDARGVTLTPAGEVLLRHAETVLAQLRAGRGRGPGGDRRRAPAPARRAPSRAPPRASCRRRWPSCAPRTPRPTSRCASSRTPRRSTRCAGASSTSRWCSTRSSCRSSCRPASRPCTCSTTRCSSRCPTATALAARSAISLADLRDDEWMVCGVGGTCIDSNVVLRACDAAGFEPRITFETEDYSAIMGMVASGMGVALIPSLALVSAREDIAIRPLRDARPVRRVRAAVAVDRPSALADALLDGPAPGRARAPVGGAAARRRRRLTLRLPPEAAPRPGSSTTTGAGSGRAHAARVHAQQLDDRRPCARTGRRSRPRCRSRWRRAGGRRPRRRRAHRWGRAASPGLPGARATSGRTAAAWRMVAGSRETSRRGGQVASAEGVFDARPGQ